MPSKARSELRHTVQLEVREKTYPPSPGSTRNQWTQGALWVQGPVCSPASELLGGRGGGGVFSLDLVSYFTKKMSLFRKSKELQFGTSKLWRSVSIAQEEKSGGSFIEEMGIVGGLFSVKSPLEGTGCPMCHGCSLAEL